MSSSKRVLKWALPVLVFGVGAVAFYASLDSWVEPEGLRQPASFSQHYESLSACQKQDLLWSNIQASVYQELPDFRKFGVLQLMAMGKQEIGIKGSHQSDFAPIGWKKYIHGRGAVAKVKLVTHGGPWTGVFQGADCGLLRLSLTFKPKGSRAVAPGLALKILRDGVPSANISALVSLEGQEKDFNFFKNALSNIVPVGHGLGAKWVHRIFEKATPYPEELLLDHLAQVDAKGAKIENFAAPRQIFFVPNPELKASSEEHDVRQDFLRIPAGTVIYQIRAVSANLKNFNYANYQPENVAEFLAGSELVADLVTTSEFVASEFGDDGLFFRHELR